MYPRLQSQYDWWWKHNQVGDALFGGGDMGMENLPRGGGAQADSSGWMAFFARDMVRIATEVGDTAAAERYWTDRGRIQTAINDKMWDAQSGFYYDLDTSGAFVPNMSYSGLDSADRGRGAGRTHPRPAGRPARSRSSSCRRPASAACRRRPALYAGRGRRRGQLELARAGLGCLSTTCLSTTCPISTPRWQTILRSRLVANVEADWQKAGRLHEYFDGDTGAGLGADSNAGTTALIANLIAEGWPASRP